MNVAWAMLWGGSRSTNLVFFRVKWLQPAMKGTSSVRRVRLGSFCARIVPPMCFARNGCSCVRNSMRFLKLWLQIALEWVHECYMLWGGSRARNLVFFRVKWLQPAMKGIPRLCDGCGWGRFVRESFLLCVLQEMVVPVYVVLCVS